MKMLKMMMWSLGTVLATTLAVAGVSPASADTTTPGDGYIAPAPTRVNASGVENDGFIVPEADFEGMFIHPDYGPGGYHLNGAKATLEAGFHNLPKGATSVTITADWNSGSWTFDDYTDDDFGEEAKNKYWVELGECGAKTEGRTPLMFFAQNVEDDTKTPVNKLTVVPTRPADPIPGGPTSAYNIQDGETREIPIYDYEGGFFPGTWNLDVFTEGSKKREARVVVWVHGCDGVTPPNGDNPPDEAAKPKASVRQLVCHRPKVRVTLNNRTTSQSAVFRVLKNGKLVKSYRLRAGVMKRVTQKAGAGSKVKVVAGGKVLVKKKIKPYRRHC